MPKRPNNRSWPENLAFDFELPMLSPAAAEAFISTLPTTERNKEFLRLRYRGDKTYAEIAAIHGMTPAGVRLAIIAMQEKFGGAAISTQVTAVEKVVPQSASTPMATPSPAVVAPSPAVAARPPAATTPPPAVTTPHPAVPYRTPRIITRQKSPPVPYPSTSPLSDVSWA